MIRAENYNDAGEIGKALSFYEERSNARTARNGRSFHDYNQVRYSLWLAEHGKASAFYELGLFYATGHGVKRDYIEAHKWFNLAAIRGVKSAITDRLELSREMKRSEIAKAQRAARAWLAQH